MRKRNLFSSPANSTFSYRRAKVTQRTLHIIYRIYTYEYVNYNIDAMLFGSTRYQNLLVFYVLERKKKDENAIFKIVVIISMIGKINLKKRIVVLVITGYE